METLKVQCITWNVETTWPEQDLHALLGVRKEAVIKRTRDDTLPDIYMVSLQEVKSQPQNVVMDVLFEEPWTLALREVIGAHNYVRIASERLQGIVCNIFIKRCHLPHVRDIHTQVVRTGLGGLWGNKGASCVRFSLYGCSICMVNCHLAAHDTGYKERVDNFNTIVDTLQFPIQETKNILYHDYVFWMGDMNFRFEPHMTSDAIARMVSEKDWQKLADVDELRKAQRTGDAFSMFKEGDLNFQPTYKYLEGTSMYDFARRPAYTDRILFQVHPDAYDNVKLSVDQTSYTALSNYTQSDHKPVTANFKIKVFANHEERCVRFAVTERWLVCEGGPFTLTLDSDVTTSPWDYISIYKVDFTAMHQYITYMYLPQQPPPSSSERTFQLQFTDELIQNAGMYRLVYYSGKYTSYLGMSDPFQVLAQP